MLFSVVSAWELVIKQALGKLALRWPVVALVNELEAALGAVVLPVALPHVLAVQGLPLHHGDPFDRLLSAQAQVEGLAIATRDRSFALYDVPIVEA